MTKCSGKNNPLSHIMFSGLCQLYISYTIVFKIALITIITFILINIKNPKQQKID